MSKKIASSVLLVTACLLATAHEFWLEPRKFQYQVGEAMNIDFMVGENFTGEFWDMKRHRAGMLKLYTSSEEIDLLANVKNTPGSKLQYQFQKEGTHMV